MAIEWRRQIDTGEVRNKTEIARREGITRARVTQVMGLLRLAPEIQDKILSFPDTLRPLLTERTLRPIVSITDSRAQSRALRKTLISSFHPLAMSEEGMRTLRDIPPR